MTPVTPWTRFVLARLDEDDAAITLGARRQRSADRAASDARAQANADETPDAVSTSRPARRTRDVPPTPWSTERMRAEIAVKRQLMGSVQELLFLRDLPMEKPVRDAALEMVKTLALPYRDHVEYPGRPAKIVLEPPAREVRPVG